MNNNTALVTTQNVEHGLVLFDQGKLDLLKRTIAKDLDDNEFELFLMRCQQTGLDPFANQIHAIKRYSTQEKRKVMNIQVSIDGLRLIADRTERYAPGRDATYTYLDGKLATATAYVKKWAQGVWHEVSETAFWDEYVQIYEDRDSGKKSLMGLWASKPHVMLSKCAEARALRRAFPAEMSGLYEKAELEQEEREEAAVDVTPRRAATPAQQLPAPRPRSTPPVDELAVRVREARETLGYTVGQCRVEFCEILGLDPQREKRQLNELWKAFADKREALAFRLESLVRGKEYQASVAMAGPDVEPEDPAWEALPSGSETRGGAEAAKAGAR